MSIIRFENTTKEFPGMGRPAVDHVDLNIDEGQFIVLVGPSGCGKTTLMKMVNRLYEPSEGTIFLRDRDIRDMSVVDLRRQIGYVIQQIGLFPHMTVLDNIAVVPKLLGWDKGRIRERADELLDLVDLPPEQYRDRYPSQMSGGQQQRVGVARALAGDPDVILMDEPFSAIDAITRTSLQDEMLQLQRQIQKTILFVTHDVDEALRLADQIVVMREGRVVQFASPFDVLNSPENDFVGELVGSDDVVRQLGLVRVETAMQDLPANYSPNGDPTIDRDDSLRNALSHLLRIDRGELTVTDGEQPVGVISLDDIRTSTS